jgi:hypothetical protein
MTLVFSNCRKWEAAYISALTQSAQDLKNVHFVGAQYGEAKWDFLIGEYYGFTNI